MYLKFAIIFPLMTAFAMNFNTKLIAQEGTPGQEKIQIEEELELITKDFTKQDLDELRSNLLKQGVEMKYKKLKYNDANEIVGIELTVSNNKGNKAKMSQRGDQPIAPISIRFDKINGTLALGNTSALHEVHTDLHTQIHKDIHKEIYKEIVIDKNGEKEVIVISGDGSHNIKTEDIDVKVIELDDDSQGVTKVIVKNGNEKPMIIINGKELPDADMSSINHENIETIEVLKGTKAIEKYGEKARDGVIIIKIRK